MITYVRPFLTRFSNRSPSSFPISSQAFDEKNIIEEEEKSHEEHLIVDGQVQPNHSERKMAKNVQKRNQIYHAADAENDAGDHDIEHADQIVDHDQDDSILQSASVDPLQLVQICVPGESDNVSWVSLVQS